MKWIGERISFVDDKDKATIVIYPENITWIKAILGAWVGMWFAVGATVTWSLFTFEFTEQETIILIVFLTFWAYYAYRVTKSFLWILWGKELIKIDEVSLSYKRSIRNYGKSVPYFLENIKKMSVHQPKERSIQTAWEKSPWIRGGERIEFEYMGKVVRFGRKLDEKDTKQLFRFVAKKMDDRLRKNEVGLIHLFH